LVHLAYLVLFIFFGVLEDAKGVDPQPAEPENVSNVNGILESPWEYQERYFLSMLAQILLRSHVSARIPPLVT
jgi:hypothetical protein